MNNNPETLCCFRHVSQIFCQTHNVQQFYYIYDTFSLPLSPESSASDLVSDTGALACNTCATQQNVQLDPDEVPVQYYVPTNKLHIEEVRPTGYALLTRSGEVEPVKVDDNDCDCDYDCDYKSLSAADDEEWDVKDEQIHDDINNSVGYDAQEQRAFEQEQVARQLSSLPNHLAQQRQQWSFVPPGLSRDVYTMGSYGYYPIPHMAYLTAPSVLPVPNGRGEVTGTSTAYSAALPTRPTKPPSAPMLPPTVGDSAKPTTSTSPTIPAKCLTGSRRPPTPPSIVGCVTDAYPRIEAAKNRHMRERARRTRSSQQDELPAKRETLLAGRDTLPDRSMSLADCVVTKRKKRVGQKEQYRSDNMGEVNVDAWSSLSIVGKEPDTDGGAEEYTGVVETGEAIDVPSRRLAVSM
ncbi:hypothetical protein ST47_g10550 [Ascochyta rabiei]|uniref:Uncharacterized protein n=1 Tax=Didymella rabiei TaxID=5454 RepID=A0A162V7U7_DIDRA|nr:hypothetical protein ST47_g10550 [Ascochyta rabiei]